MIIRKIQKAPTKKVKRAAAYCRVSTVDQSESYETQRAVYRSMIEADPELSFAGIYADKGKSGTNVKNRPGFQQMLADAAAGDRKSTRLNSSHAKTSRMPSSA